MLAESVPSPRSSTRPIRTLLIGFRHLAKLLLQVADLIAKTRCKLELQLLGGSMHLFGKLADQPRQVLCGQAGLEIHLKALDRLVLVQHWHAEMRDAGLARIAVTAFEQRLRIHILLGEHVVHVADLLD